MNIKKITSFLLRHAAAIGAVAVLGVIALSVSVLLTYKDRQRAQQTLVDSLSFFHEKIVSYESYASNDRIKSLIRLLDKATELDHNIKLDHSDLTVLLDSFCKRQRLSGAIILDGALGCTAASTSDGDPYERWKDVINSENVRDITARPAKCYLTRNVLGGDTYDFAAMSREDQEGIVIVYEKNLPVLDPNGEIDIASLFDNYPLTMNGIIVVSDGETVIGSNSDELRSMSVVDCELLSADFPRSNLLTRSSCDGSTWYGGMQHSHDYTLYVFFPASEVFAGRTLVMTYILSFGLIVLMLFVLARNISAHRHMAQLRAEAERADRANISKTDFLRHMSHDLRTPINGIRGMIEISRHYKGNEKKQEDCRAKIYEASGFLLDLINNILDMNKLESGEITLENEPFGLRETVDRVVGTVEPIAIERSVRLRLCEPEIKHDSLIGCGIHLRRILHNLIGNAVKYNKPGGSVTVSIRELPVSEYPEAVRTAFCASDAASKAISDAASKAISDATSNTTSSAASVVSSDGTSPVSMPPVNVSNADNASHDTTAATSCDAPDCDDYAVFELTVADTGIGMSREFQAHAFEPFAQENSASRAACMGTGLGLAITHEIVEKMGGDIVFRSEQGKGTVFTVHLGFRINHGSIRQSAAAPRSHRSLAGARILLAEDNELNAEIAEFTLEQAGMSVSVARNGSEAVSMFLDSDIGSYDAILMDVMMPVVDGLEATRRIRASDRADAKTVPILAMTANAFSDDRADCLKAGMNEHITKPINSDDLLDKIERCLADTSAEGDGCMQTENGHANKQGDDAK